MLKNILKLEGAQQLKKNEQKEVNGGGHFPWSNDGCPTAQCLNSFGRCSIAHCTNVPVFYY